MIRSVTAAEAADTLVLGYTNGLVAYLPRAEDYPDGGWELEGDYAVPDLMPQAWQLPVAFRPDSADRVVECAAGLIASPRLSPRPTRRATGGSGKPEIRHYRFRYRFSR